jgi:uncharacterized delta-60 repeat protein
VKRLLLILVLWVCTARAQNEVSLSSAFGAGEGINGAVFALAIQADGNIVVGGRFSAVNGIVRNNIARLNADGTLDRTFAEGSSHGVNGEVSALAIQAEGGIIVGGTFSQAGQFQTSNLARFHPDGRVDKTFGGENATEPGANGSVYALAVQADGKIVVGGNFNTIFGQQRRGIARLNRDGTLDSPMTAQDALTGTIKALACGAGIVVGGGQFSLPSQDARNLLRISEDFELRSK